MSTQLSKIRWLLTLVGVFLYLLDIGTDLALALRYCQEGNYLWMSLTILFVLTGLLVTQLFSYCWYLDDKKELPFHPDGREARSRMTKAELLTLHIFGLSIFTRYCHLLSTSYKVVWKGNYNQVDRSEVHRHLFGLAVNLSMLKLFESFLEGVPQLILQIYINLGHHETSAIQYVSITFSFCSIAWALVDFRRCLGKSQPDVKEMPLGFPTLLYLLYKLFTITSHILSFIFLLILSAYSLIALAVLWLLGTIWTHFQRTDFCPKSKGLEFVYRTVIGVILAFTFFKVKGEDTKIPMTVYYVLSSLKNIAAILLLAFLKPEVQEAPYFMLLSCVIFVGTVLGMLCLVVYYAFFHRSRAADEVDGAEKQNETTTRMRNFIQA